MDEQRLQELNAIRDRMAGGMSGYQAINYNSLPQNPVPFQNYSNFVNEQNEIETDYKLFKSFYNGGVSIINGMIGTGRMLADRRLSYEAQEGEAAGMAGVSSAAAAEVNKPTTLLKRYNIQANTTTEQLIYGVAEGATQLAGQALVTLATGGIGGGIFMGAQIAGNQYNELRDAGVEPDRAFEASVANALIQTPLEQLSFGKLMKSLPANSKLKAKLYQVLESTLTEGLTEGLQELPEQLTSIWAKNNGIDALGVAREWDKNASDNIKDMVYSGVIGGILGGGASGIRVAISSKLEKAFIDYQNENITASAENAKKNGMSAQQTQQIVDLNDRGETAVNIDAQQVLSYAQTQQVGVDKVARSLGVTTSEIEDAAEAGLDITVSKGHMVQAMMEQNGFSEAIIPHVSYGEQGRSLNYYQMQEEVSKAYGEGSEVVKALDEELNAIEQSMVDAGIPKDQAKQARELYNAFAVSMSPENPAEWIKNHKVRFANEGKVSKNGLFQIAFHGTTTRGIDKLSTKFVGMNAAFHGWGLYFGGKRLAVNYAIPESEKVTIQSKLGAYSGGDGGWTNIRTGANVPTNSPLSIALDFISVQQTAKNYGTSYNEFIENVKDHCEQLGLSQEQTDKTVRLVKENLNAKIQEGGQLDNGDIFKVDIPEDNELLNFDKTVGEQSPKIKEILNRLGFSDDVSGQEVYDSLTEEKGSQKEASLFLNSNGISGHYVVDGDEGPTYVIYNEAVVNHLGKEQVPKNIPDNFYADEAEFYKKYTSKVEQWQRNQEQRANEVAQYEAEIEQLFDNLYGFNTNIKNHLRFRNALQDYIYSMHSDAQDEFGFTVEGAKKVISDLKKLEDGLNDGSIKEQEFYNLVDSYMEQHYNQSPEGTLKGSFTPQADGSYVISMFKNGDASTVIHETGHYFFEVFMQESGLDTASDKLKKDRAAFLNYVGMTDEQWQAADFEGRRAAHERVATAFEQYLLEGKAPSKGLRGVFSRFSKWLKAIYGEVVKSDDYAELTDDVRQVFDHWLAADADIEEAARMQGYFGRLDSKLTANLSDKQKKWLEDKIYSAREKAIEILTKKYMENFRPERRAEIEAFRKTMEPVIRENAKNEQVNRARAMIVESFPKTVKKVDTAFRARLDYNTGRYYAVSTKDKREILVYLNPKVIARRYMYIYENPSVGYVENLQSINKKIDELVNPVIENLKQGMGRRSKIEYIDNDTKQVISQEEAESRDPQNKRYKMKFVSQNDPWYQKWFKKENRQPTKAELRQIAIDLLMGHDEYGFYGVTVGQQKQYYDDMQKTRELLTSLFLARSELEQNPNSEILLKNYDKFVMPADERLYFDMIAEELGYSSGSEMAQDILNMPSEEQMVRDELEQLVKDNFPDYTQEKAERELAIVESLNNDKEGEVIALEQQLIDEAAQTAFEREQSTQARMAKAAEAKAKAEVTARNTLLNMSMREALNIRRFAMAERRAAASAKKAIKAGDFEAASEFKRQQMIAHAMVRHSAKLKQEVERTKKFVKRLRKLKKDKEHFGNEQNFNQIAHLLYRLGIVRKDYNPNNRTQTLAEYLAEMTDKLGDGVPDIDESITNEMNDLIDSRNMTIEQYEKIRDALQNLYAIVKQDVQGTLDAKAKDFEETKTNITDNLNKLKTKYTPSIGGVDNESFWKRQIAQRQSLDNFLEMMDGWTLGYFSKTFGAPLKHAADLQAKLTMEYEDAVSAAMKKWLPNAEARRAADTERYYEELGGNANKHTLVNMLIHLGNQSSMERLCTSRVEGAENSKLWIFPDANNNLTREEAIAMTRENLINFLGKNLTAADVEFAQAKVDAANKLWPLLAQVNIDTKGFAPAKVEATPIAFKPSDGDYMTFRGGYYPLARDSRLGSQRQGAEAFTGTEDGSAPIRTMSTVQNTSKGRTNASYPVKLNYGYEMGIIQDTIHDIAYRQVMMNFNKIFSDKDIASLMKRKLGLENYNILKETLWKCARPRSLQDSVMAERSLTQAANWIRRKTVNAIIACNLKISLQNLGNVFLFGNTVEGFTQADVMAALPKILSGLQSHKAMRQEVFAKSIFMRERAKAPDFAMKEVAEENAIIKANKRAKGVVNKVTEKLTWAEETSQTFGAKMLEVTDNITAVPVWLQAYNKKLQAGASEQEAIDFADTVIRRTLGSNRLQDVSSIQRGSSMYKLFTAFQSFFNTQFNQWWREANIDYKLYTKGEYKEAFMRVMSFALSKWIFACLANTIIGSLSFIKPFEKDEKKKWRDITQELITYPISMTGGVGGQVALASTQALLGMQSYGYRLSIIENTLTKGVSLGTKINTVAQGKKDVDELAEPVAEITAIMLGLPLQFVRTPANLLNIAFDDMNFELEDIMNRRKKSERNRN